MKKRILLTSFDTWLDDQHSNSSDDLLFEVSKLDSLPYDLKFLRLLPVDIELASYRVMAKIETYQPDYIVCCGMAASRQKLSLELGARRGESFLQTTIDVKKLVSGAKATYISDDCGKFVCEGLYYSVLNYLEQNKLAAHCIFVHVPVLNQENFIEILTDFLLIIHNIALL
ncbi:pyroglutamyl-peptidase I family protein [Nostoc sp. UHCC 0870]|uniref:pyroglutamyl-peptidase I family protein n=1 Tax=Nostoc sp. UHCC 0870 TaxID=2914041 RepID=UPI001EDE23C6|nr:peptidase C15 [Nostoc sp. UHCC 0870]UKO99758.1 peptidase C15 [Nostoc sp. UHCC 0870]